MATHPHAQVSDFNLSRIMELGCTVADSVAATNPRWLAPEVIDSQGATFASVSGGGKRQASCGLLCKGACTEGQEVHPGLCTASFSSIRCQGRHAHGRPAILLPRSYV
jgi:hypothetical protein